MILREALLKEHSREQCNRIVSYVGNNKKRFAELMRLFFEDEYRVVQRASWPISICVEKHPELISPYIKRLLNNLSRKGVHNAVIRNTMRLLQYVAVQPKYHGQLMNICFELIQSNEMPVAPKAFSLSILHNMSVQYPEIIPELKLIIEDRWEHETVAFRTRAKKILKQAG